MVSKKINGDIIVHMSDKKYVYIGLRALTRPYSSEFSTIAFQPNVRTRETSLSHLRNGYEKIVDNPLINW